MLNFRTKSLNKFVITLKRPFLLRQLNEVSNQLSPIIYLWIYLNLLSITFLRKTRLWIWRVFIGNDNSKRIVILSLRRPYPSYTVESVNNFYSNNLSLSWLTDPSFLRLMPLDLLFSFRQLIQKQLYTWHVIKTPSLSRQNSSRNLYWRSNFTDSRVFSLDFQNVSLYTFCGFYHTL